jgi:type IV secretory pathway TraG/TraD family ATPase VirD4
MKRAGLKRLHKTLVVLFGLCGVGGLFSLFFGGKAGVTALLDAGWGSYVNAPENSKVAFVFSCLTNGECRPILRERFTAQDFFLLTRALFIGFIVFMLAAIVVSWFANAGPDEKDPGGGHFATDEDLKAYLKDSKDPDNQRKGHYGYTESGKQLRAPSQDRCTHLAIFAGTGGGKTTRIIKPSLIQDSLDGTSVLMVDPKWPDPRGGYSDMLAVFAAKGYDVQVFCPFEENTLGLPLIGGLESHADAEALATTIIPKAGAGETSDGSQFYRNQERELLKHLLWGEAQAGRGSMGGIYDLLDGGPKELTAWVAACEDPKIIRSMGTLLQLRYETIVGLLQGLKGTLSIFTNEQLDAATQAGPYEWQNLRPASLTERKSVLYVGIPQQMFLRGDGKLLLNLFFRRIMDEIMGIARQQGGTLKRQLAVYIDEFANIGKLDDAGSWFGTMRSYNIAFTIAMQNRAQLELIYGTIGAKAMSGGNFQHLITFPASLTGDDKEYISKLLGEVTAEEVTESESRQHMFEPFRRTKTRRRVARPLLSREEMNNWDSNYGILVPHGAGPTKIVAPRIDQKRVGGVKNHFHAYRNTVGAGDSTVLVQGLLNRHRLMTRTRMPRRPEEPQAPKTDDTSDFEFTEPQDLYGKGVVARGLSVTVVEAPKPVTAFAQVVKVDEPALAAPPGATTPSKTKKPPKTKSTAKKSPVKVEPLHHVPSGELMPSFRAWVDSLSWREVPLTVFRVREGGQDRVSKILFERLPGAMRHEHLAHWKQRNWIRVHGGKLGIVNNGCVVLCPMQIDTFMASPQAQVVEIGEGSERVVVKPRVTSVLAADCTNEGNQATDAQAVDTLPVGGDAPTPPPPSFTPEALKDPHIQVKVRSWIARHGCLLNNHPSHTLLHDSMQVPEDALLGSYQPRMLYVSEAYLTNLEGFPPKAIKRFPSTTQKLAASGNKVALRKIPGEVAARITSLKRLFDEDAHLLVGHPNCTDQGRAIGKCQKEGARLAKPQCEEATGLSFDGLQSKTLRVGKGEQYVRGFELSLPP